MFSIIIPLFNKGLYIEKCLYSVLTQSFHDFEIIVVNDGSTDDGPDKAIRVIEENKNVEVGKANSLPTIKLINQINSGVSKARNAGVRNAKYDFIAFLDADDWWENSYLEELKLLVDNFPEAGIYGSCYYLVKNNKKRIAPIGIEPGFSKGTINYYKVYAKTLCMPLWTGATVIRKSIFEAENGFKPELKLGEDFDLWIRVALKYPVAFLNKPLSNYNQDVELKGRSIGKLHEPDTHMLWNFEYLQREEQANPDLKQLLDNLRVYNLYPYFLNKNYREQTRNELKKIDWTKQPRSAKRKYEYPLLVLHAWSFAMLIGSRLKQKMIKMMRSIQA